MFQAKATLVEISVDFNKQEMLERGGKPAMALVSHGFLVIKGQWTSISSVGLE